MVPALERAKDESWSEFEDRHGDGGRDAGLWLGQLGELAGGMHHAAVSKARARFGQRLRGGARLRGQLIATGDHSST